MLRKLLATAATAAVILTSLTLSSIMLPGCGGEKVRDLPGGQMPVPTAEEKATLKADPSQK